MGKANFNVSTTARQWEGVRKSRWSLLLALCATTFCCLSFATLARADLPDFTALVKNNEAAVVNISTVGETPSNRNSNRPRDPRMEEFYRFFGPPNGRGAPGTPNNERPSPPRRSLGSGFIIEEDGYISVSYTHLTLPTKA